ncbi:MAG: LysR substrate-binding domain-containing protein [Parvibaculaceae bacterium]
MAETPPLQAIKVFDAVARHLSFTKAAAELNMTQSAVSYQIKLIEGFIGAPLFVRQARGVALSERGREVAPVVRRALGDLAQTFRSAREETSSVLSITSVHTFTVFWLAPRIGSFQLAYPDIAVRIDTQARLVDLENEGFDLAIRSGKGKWPGLVTHYLIEECFTPVCSPAYLEREGTPKTPGELLKRILIGPSDPWWPAWFAAAGVDAPSAIPRPGIDVETQQMAASLAVAGQGVAMVNPGFLAEDVASGRLVRLFDITGTTGNHFYLAYPESRRTLAKIRAFRDWILAEAGRSHDAQIARA